MASNPVVVEGVGGTYEVYTPRPKKKTTSKTVKQTKKVTKKSTKGKK